jgi:hypothetical protein
MKKSFAVLVITGFAAVAMAQNPPELNNGNIHFYPTQGWARPGGGGSSNLVYHSGGSVIPVAKAVFIFWGPSFNSPTSPDSTYAATLQNFRNQFGTTPEYNVITQYFQNLGAGNQFIQLSNLGLGTPDLFDTSTPPTNVTDADVQAEVQRYLQAQPVDYSTVYEVFIPSTSFSSSGSSDSCGGPNLQYCAYHSHYTDASGQPIKYSIEPYPSCAGCQVSGFTAAENQEHFVCHETREAVTDALGNAWFDRRGFEADDKCAWTPTPFIGTNGYAYQYEWSNAVSGCVRTR